MSNPPLRPGISGDPVREIRQKLRLAGFDVADGDTYDEATAAAVEAFQRSRGLVGDGLCGPQTLAALDEAGFGLGDRLLYLSSPMLRGDDVAELQRRLGTLGFDAGKVDGIFGPATQTAMEEFQRNAGLTADLICGPETVKALVRYGKRSGAASVSAVREREHLRTRGFGVSGARVALGAMGEADDLVALVGAGLQSSGAEVALLTDAEWPSQAQQANEFASNVYLGLSLVPDAAATAAFFAAPGFDSVGGRHLAELVCSYLPAIVGVPRVTPEGMRTPILRETRSPAVVITLGPVEAVRAQADLLVTALQAAVSEWLVRPPD